MEGFPKKESLIEGSRCGCNEPIVFRVRKLISANNFSLKMNVLKHHTKSDYLQLPQNIGGNMLLQLQRSGYGYYVNIVPDGIDAILVPTINKNIWFLSVIDGDKLAINSKTQQQSEAPILINKSGQLNEVLSVSELYKLPNFIVDKTYKELMCEVPLSTNQEITTTSEPQLSKIEDFTEFSKTSGLLSSAKMQPVNDLITIDPLMFLADRYYSTVYTQKSMILHFAKSALPKIHLSCQKNLKKVFEILNKALISNIEELHNKYDNILNDQLIIQQLKEKWILIRSIFGVEKEIEYKEMFCIHWNEKLTTGIKLSSSQAFRAAWDELKIKETKLQIILALELLKIIKEKPDILENQKTKVTKPLKRKRNQLVGKKKRLIPTLLGTMVPTTVNFDFDFRFQETQPLDEMVIKSTAVRTNESIINLINLLFDLLTVQDALIGRTHKEPLSAYSFVVTCLIPFYEKAHLSLLKQLVGKVRGASYLAKRKTKKEKERKKREKQRSSKVSFHETRSFRDISILEDELKPNREGSFSEKSDLKLRRTHSSFSTKLDLERKGFDMVKSSSNLTVFHRQIETDILSSTNTIIDDIGISSQPKPQTLGSFMTSRKKQRELKAQSSIMKESNAEAETPQKIKKRSSVLNKMFANEQQFHPDDIIQATPVKRRIKTLAESDDVISVAKKQHKRSDLSNSNGSPFHISIQQTPIRKLGVGRSIVSPIKETINKINSTPLKPPGGIEVDLTPNKLNKHGLVINETPKIVRVEIKPGVFEITSSPMKSPLAHTPRNPHRVIDSSPIVQMPHASARIKSANNNNTIIPMTPQKAKKSTNRKLEFN